ncbi:aspartate ammonia-lyase [Paraburkholderia sp. Cy-641]|nr:aspartate ammonia-lyase [Paraburkholderia sp. Cy-641]
MMKRAMKGYRTESDSLGDCELPVDALYGINTLRAKQNFQYSDEVLAQYPRLVGWLARTKRAIARVHVRHGKLTREQGECISAACLELVQGHHTEALIVDPLEGACGTSINMNINEVIANRALQLMGHAPGEYRFLHPIDHVNLGQSTSDALLSAMKLALHEETQTVGNVVRQLALSLRDKQSEFGGVLRLGRTCLQDALPMRLDQAFGGYASLAERSASALVAQLPALRAICLGATAVGTGLGSYCGYREAVTAELSELAGMQLTQVDDLFDAVQNMDGFATLAATIKTVALSLSKIANDILLLSSGPRGGIAELALAPHQAGSSMMPGKINPVHAIGLTQAAFMISGAEHSVMLACAGGQLENNNYKPLIATCLFKALRLVERAVFLFDTHVVRPLKADHELSMRHLVDSMAIAPVVKEKIGYARTSSLVRQAVASGKTLLKVLVDEGIVSEGEVQELLRQSSFHPDLPHSQM